MRLPDSEKKRLHHQYGPWALVTGATSGIGLELAMQLADAVFLYGASPVSKYNLVINARHFSSLLRINYPELCPHNCAEGVKSAHYGENHGWIYG